MKRVRREDVLTADDVQKMVLLHAEGVTATALAIRFGRTPGWIRAILRTQSLLTVVISPASSGMPLMAAASL